MYAEPTCPKLPWMVNFNSPDSGEVLSQQYSAAFAESQLENLTKLNIKSRPSVFRCTQLVCMITPNTSIATMVELLHQGMTAAMISSNKADKTKEIIAKLRSLVEGYSRRIGRVFPLGIGLEIKGVEIRIGTVKNSNKQVFMEKGKVTKLTTIPSYEETVCEDMIYVDYEKLPEVIQPGDRVVLDNGSVTLTALECVESIIRCIVEKAGMLISNASVTVPNVIPEARPKLSPTDMELMQLAKSQAIDYLFVSCIQNKQSVIDIKELLNSTTIHIIVKIENQLAVEKIDEIIQEADGVLIDCDRLLIQMPKEKIFLIQKSITAKCNLAGKPVIVTASLSDPRYLSKAEISDISNIVIGGCDGLMLPRESNNLEMLKTISVICKEAEPAIYHKRLFYELITHMPAPMEPIYSLGISVVESASLCKASAIVCLTSSGRTAKIISRFKARCPILAVTRYPRVARILSIYRGIEALIYLKPFCGEYNHDVDMRIQLGVTYGKYIGYIRTDDAVITVAPSRPGSGMANTMKIVYASEFDTLGVLPTSCSKAPSHASHTGQKCRK